MPDNQQRENSGVLFRNEHKKEDRHPDYQGKAMIGTPGVEYRMSAWIKTSKDGSKKFMSIAFSIPQPKVGQKAAEPAAEQDQSSLPF